MIIDCASSYTRLENSDLYSIIGLDILLLHLMRWYGIVIGQIWAPPWYPSRHIRQDACRLWCWVCERVGEHYLVATIITALRLDFRANHFY